MQHPLITIITVVYNNEKQIADTIKSVINQNYDNKEYIIVDGKSKDSTLIIINQFKEYITKIISEEDEGLYDAMNKGIKLANGKLIVLLNSDDRFHTQDSLQNIVTCYNKTEGNVLLVSDTIMIDPDKKNKNGRFKAFYSDTFYYRIPFMHTSCVVPKSFYDDFGLYDTRYRIAADVDFLLRLFTKNVKYITCDSPFVDMNVGGVSDVLFLNGRREYRKAYITNNSKTIKNYLLAELGYYRSYLKYYLVKVKKYFKL